MPQAEDTSAPGDIPDGLDNKQGGEPAVRVEHRPHLHDRLAAGRTHVEVDNMDMTSTPLVACIVARYLARPREGHRLVDPVGRPTDPRQ
jgi:hypothetical protein